MEKQFPFEILWLMLIQALISITFIAVQIPAVERQEFRNLESIVQLKAERIEKSLDELRGDCDVLKG